MEQSNEPLMIGDLSENWKKVNTKSGSLNANMQMQRNVTKCMKRVSTMFYHRLYMKFIMYSMLWMILQLLKTVNDVFNCVVADGKKNYV